MCQFVTRSDKEGYEIRTIEQFKTELELQDTNIFLQTSKNLSEIKYDASDCLCGIDIARTLEINGYLTGEPNDKIYLPNGRWTIRQDISFGDFYIIGRWQNLKLFEKKEAAKNGN